MIGLRQRVTKTPKPAMVVSASSVLVFVSTMTQLCPPSMSWVQQRASCLSPRSEHTHSYRWFCLMNRMFGNFFFFLFSNSAGNSKISFLTSFITNLVEPKYYTFNVLWHITVFCGFSGCVSTSTLNVYIEYISIKRDIQVWADFHAVCPIFAT